MKVIKATQQMLETRTLVLGFQGENLRTQLRIDCAATFAEYPNATPALAVKPSSGETYPVFVERDGNEVVWDIVANNLVLKGDGELQLTFYKDNVIAKTVIGTIRVNRSLQIDGEMPDVVATWIENANRKLAEVDAQIVELEGMVDTATEAAQSASESAEIATEEAVHAEGSAETATAKANEATQAAGTATAKAAEAQTAAQTATTKATAAAESERIATEKAGEATTAAGTATAKAEQATDAAQTATEKAGDALASATAAHASEINAAESADDALSAEVGANAAKRAAETSATQAGISEQNAGTAAQTATQKAAEATQSATNAATFAGTATTRAEEAAASAQAAQDAQTAVEQTAEQLADSLEQIDQNTQDIAELDERKANVDGYYPDMTVGNAEQLNSSKYVENSEPYTLRTSGGTSDIGNRKYVDAVVGGTLAWNQAVRDEASENSTDFADVVTVTDAVEDAAGVKVKLEPVQDLHGYDHPWPAGGGKNLIDVADFSVNAGDGSVFRQLGSSVELSAGTYTLSWTQTGDIVSNTRNTPCYKINGGNYIYQMASENINLGSGRKKWTITLSEDASVIIGYWTHTLSTACDYIDFQFEKGSTDTEYAPYSNICPITGWDGVKASRTGKNLWGGEKLADDIAAKVTGAVKSATAKTITYAAQAIDKVVLFERFKPNTQYTVILNGTGYANMQFMYSDGTTQTFGGTLSTTSKEFTSTSSKSIVALTGLWSSGQTVLNYEQCGLFDGVIAVDNFMPYTGTTYSISLPTEAGTVYGGELTVSADGSGSLVVDRASVDLGTLTWSRSGDSPEGGNLFVTTGVVDKHFGTENIVCSEYPNAGNMRPALIGNMTIVGNANNRNVYIRNDLFSDSALFKTAVSGVQLVYELATTVTYQLTASQIRTFLGENHVWADTGDVALTYTGTDEHLTLESGKKYLARLSGTDSMLLGSGQEVTAAKGQDNVFDLTKMFGTAVADYVYGQGAAFFRKWFPNAVYPYNAGELRHVEGLQSHDMVGFNLFDAEAVLVPLGFVKQSDGSLYLERAATVQAATVLWTNEAQYDGTICISYEYKNNSGATSGGVRFRFDYVDGTRSSTYPSPSSAYTAFSAVSTTGKKVKQITYDYGSGAVSTWLKNVCFNFSHNGSRNGEYAPFEKHSYPLDSSVVLRGIPKVGASGVYWDGDRYLPDGTVERRYGVVDLGTLNWTYISSPNRFSANFALAKWNNTNTVPSAMCIMYNVGSFSSSISNPSEKNIFFWGATSSTASTNVNVIDSEYSDAATFKSAMSGVLLVYELATPTIETAQPYHSTQWVSDWGTEEFVSTGIVPVGHETRYPANLRDKLQHLPDAASGNGSYLITQTDGQMVLTPFPAPPSTAGNYVLKATVVNGVATYTWEVAT